MDNNERIGHFYLSGKPKPEGYSDELLQSLENLSFAMENNGYFRQEGEWFFDDSLTKEFTHQYKGQEVSFFGPNGDESEFFSTALDVHARFFKEAFDQPSVLKIIRRYRSIDQKLAARLTFLMGGLVRYLESEDAPYIDNYGNSAGAVKFLARKLQLGQRESADTIAGAIAMYIISGGSLETNNQFDRDIYYMAEAISEDPIRPRETDELGLSQAARLYHFLGREINGEARPLPVFAEHREALRGFPTVGAEFHLPINTITESPSLWRKLAILNMSQYQLGSYIQLSRDDQGVIEVRMNPSIYPITIANWNLMKFILPELRKSFFSITINRPNKDFSWENKDDNRLLRDLQSIAYLSYAATFGDVPDTSELGEVNLGDVYLGQTLKMREGKYSLTGNWGGKTQGEHGQCSIFAGYGDDFPHLAYFTSMALVRPEILSTKGDLLTQTNTLQDTVNINQSDMQLYFSRLRSRIKSDPQLQQATEAGEDIMHSLYL